MDYEFKIRTMEKELAHLREMQQLMSEHQDAHDRTFEGVGMRLNEVDALLFKLADAQLKTERSMQQLEKSMQQLIDLMLGQHKN